MGGVGGTSGGDWEDGEMIVDFDIYGTGEGGEGGEGGDDMECSGLNSEDTGVVVDEIGFNMMSMKI